MAPPIEKPTRVALSVMLLERIRKKLATRLASQTLRYLSSIRHNNKTCFRQSELYMWNVCRACLYQLSQDRLIPQHYFNIKSQILKSMRPRSWPLILGQGPLSKAFLTA